MKDVLGNIWTAVCYVAIVWWTLRGLKIMFFDFFVSRSEHDALQCAYEVQVKKYLNLQAQWNQLVNLVNNRGGLNYLNRPPPAAVTKEDIRVLLQLCHPDKHQGRQIAQEMTAKLLAMREKL